jgi:hypothetical protein
MVVVGWGRGGMGMNGGSALTTGWKSNGVRADVPGASDWGCPVSRHGISFTSDYHIVGSGCADLSKKGRAACSLGSCEWQSLDRGILHSVMASHALKQVRTVTRARNNSLIFSAGDCPHHRATSTDQCLTLNAQPQQAP